MKSVRACGIREVCLNLQITTIKRSEELFFFDMCTVKFNNVQRFEKVLWARVAFRCINKVII